MLKGGIERSVVEVGGKTVVKVESKTVVEVESKTNKGHRSNPSSFLQDCLEE